MIELGFVPITYMCKSISRRRQGQHCAKQKHPFPTWYVRNVSKAQSKIPGSYRNIAMVIDVVFTVIGRKLLGVLVKM
jgi:hypothetical protein